MGFLLAALTGGFLFFHSQATPQKAAAKLEAALRKKFPDAQVKVEVEGRRGLNVISGKYGVVRVRMDGFKAGSGAVSLYAIPYARKEGSFGKAIVNLRNFDLGATHLEEADVEVSHVVYDFNALKKRGQLAVVSAGPGSGRLLIADKSLEGLIRNKLPQLQDPRLTLHNGLLQVSGKRAAPVIGTPIAFEFSAKPVARGGELWMEEIRVSLGGAALPPLLGNNLLGEINPAFVFDPEGKWPFRIASSSAVVHEGALELFATLNFVPVKKSGHEGVASTVKASQD